MKALGERGEERVHRVVDDGLQVEHEALVVEAEMEFLLEFAHRLVGLGGDVGHARVAHERHQVQEQVRVSAQVQERREQVLSEGLEVLRVRPGPAHRLHHLPTQFDERRHRLRVAAQYEAEVDVQQAAVRVQQQVAVMPVADAEQVRDRRVAGAAAHVVVEHFRADTSRTGTGTRTRSARRRRRRRRARRCRDRCSRTRTRTCTCTAG